MVEEAKKKALEQLERIQAATNIDWPARDICKKAFDETLTVFAEVVRADERRKIILEKIGEAIDG